MGWVFHSVDTQAHVHTRAHALLSISDSLSHKVLFSILFLKGQLQLAKIQTPQIPFKNIINTTSKCSCKNCI